jgi:16S rRNA (guanine527-N7)-methyltransferase
VDRPLSEADDLFGVLDEARRLGFLGSAPTTDVVTHARAFLPPLSRARQILDLGSGGGVPGLVIAAVRPDAALVLLDASERRTDWLRRAVARLGWGERVEVMTGRAEQIGRQRAWRGTQDAVVARSFGPPLVTAECAAPFLRVGGRLVVSEPPETPADRWPGDALAEIGLRAVSQPAGPGVAVFDQVTPSPPNVPRLAVVRRR